jgi:hypothetical protein
MIETIQNTTNSNVQFALVSYASSSLEAKGKVESYDFSSVINGTKNVECFSGETNCDIAIGLNAVQSLSFREGAIKLCFILAETSFTFQSTWKRYDPIVTSRKLDKNRISVHSVACEEFLAKRLGTEVS